MSKYITLVEGDLVCNIPKGMANGEVIQALFPNETLFEQTETCTYYGNMRFDTEWWNAPYQKGGE